MKNKLEENAGAAVRPELLAGRLRFSDVSWIEGDDQLVWLESRSDRGVLVAGDPSRPGARDLTREQPVRAGVGYGGGDFSCRSSQLLFISGPGLYFLDSAAVKPRLLLESEGDLTSPRFAPGNRRAAFIESLADRERVAVLSAEGTAVLDVDTGPDFNMQPEWHPSGRYLAWVAWDHPFMPWERSSVRIASFSASGRVSEITGLEDRLESAVFQPVFSPDGRHLALVSDANGWANLRIYAFPSLELVREVREPREHSFPAWIQGLRTMAWIPDGSGLYLIRNAGGFCDLARFRLDQAGPEKIRGDIEAFTFLSQIAVSSVGRVALIGSSPSRPSAVLVTGGDGAVQVIRRSLPGETTHPEPAGPDAVAWIPSRESAAGADAPGRDSREPVKCHGIFYRAAEPRSGTGTSASHPGSAVIRIHGGPTSCYYAEYDPDVQFYTTRGYAVLALNYRGSTGYGRAYRSLLDGRWGISDVEDVRDAAEYLVNRGLADRKRIFLDGGSAGGFTLLLSLIRNPGFFAGGICRYGIADLLMLAEETHRFEAHYLDTLIGKLPEEADCYRERSPLESLDSLVDPIAVFQGADDRVVPLNQAEAIVRSLVRRGVPHLFRVFAGEGHGWKKQESIRSYYQAVEEFLAGLD